MSVGAKAFPILPMSWQKGELRIVAVVVAICCAAGMLSAALGGGSIATELLIANCIGSASSRSRR